MTARARQGDRGAFEELVRATSADIYALALRLTGNEHDARDIVQETYLRAYRSIRRFRGESSVSTWLYRIAANCSATMHHRRQLAPVVSIDTDGRADSLTSDHRPDPVGSVAADRDRLVRAIATLPPTLRAVVVLHEAYDLSHDEVGSLLGISSATSRVRLHRARRLLRATPLAEPVTMAVVPPEAEVSQAEPSQAEPSQAVPDGVTGQDPGATARAI